MEIKFPKLSSSGGEMSNKPSKWSRRTLLKTLTASPLFLAQGLLRAQDEISKVRVVLSYPMGMWYFEPFGLYIEKGQTVEFPSPTAPFIPAVGRWEVLPIPFMLSALMESKFGRRDETPPL